MKKDAGFSFVEVIIAIGVLAGVLVAISSMFLMGGRQVKVGKTMTEATTLCHDIMEALDTTSFTALYVDMGAATTDTTRTVFSNVSGSPIESWGTEIRRKLEGGVASVTLTPMGPGTPTFGSATGIRINVNLTWSELGRQQTVRLSTTRF
jgi:type II secretory pathway pseudopilin PulG